MKKKKGKNEGLSLQKRNYIEGGKINSSKMLEKTIWKNVLCSPTMDIK